MRGSKEIAAQQMRLDRATHTSMGPAGSGAYAMTVPASAAIVKDAQYATQLLNKELRIKGEILAGLGTKIQNWGKNTQWAGRQLTVGLTMPFAMAAAAAGKYAYNIDQAMVRIEKVYSGSVEGLREQAMETSRDITGRLGVTAQSSLAAMETLAASGKKGAELMNMSTEAQRLSVLGNVEQEESIKGLISMQNIYKLSTEELADAVNYLDVVDSKTPTRIRDLVEAIPIAGTVVAQLGGDLRETTALLAAFRDRGITTVEGANAIKTAMNRILVPTRQAQDLFRQFTGQDLPELVKATGGQPLETFKALAEAIKGGNVAAEDQQKIIGKLVGIWQTHKISGLMESLLDTSGSVQEVLKINEESAASLAAIAKKHEEAVTESASAKFTKAVEDFKIQFNEFGQTALKIATVLVKAFTTVFEVFNSMPSSIKTFAVTILGLTAIAGPVLMFTGILGNLFGSVMKAAGAFLKLKGGTQILTVEEKAAELQAKALANAKLTQAETTQVLIYQLEKLAAAYKGVNAAASQSMLVKDQFPDMTVALKRRDVALAAEKAARARMNDLVAQQQSILNNPMRATHSPSYAGGFIIRNQADRAEYNRLTTEIKAQQIKVTSALNERKAAVTAAIKAETTAMTGALREQAMQVRAEMLKTGQQQAQDVTVGGLSFRQDRSGRWQKFDQSRGKFMGFATKDQTKAIKEGWDSVDTGVQQAESSVEGLTKKQKVFNSEVGYSVGLVAGLGASFMESGSAAQKLLTFVSMTSVAVSALGPMVGKLFDSAKSNALVGSVSSAIANSSSVIVGKARTAFSSLAGFAKGLFSPAGLGILAAGAAVWGLVRLINSGREEQIRIQESLNNSTETWSNILGRTAVKWGQIKDDSGEVKESVESMAKSLRESDDEGTQDLIKEFTKRQGSELMSLAIRETNKMIGQDIPVEEIEMAIKAMLDAAGRSVRERDDLWVKIEGRVDFENSMPALNRFAGQAANKMQAVLDEAQRAIQERHAKVSYSAAGGMPVGLSKEDKRALATEASEIMGRLTSLNDTDKRMAVTALADQMNEVTNASFEELKSKYGARLQGSFSEASAEMLRYDDKLELFMPKDKADQAAQSLARLKNENLEVARSWAVGAERGEEQVKSLRNLNDIVPMLASGFSTSAQIQEAYNNQLKLAKSAGEELTREEEMAIAKQYVKGTGMSALSLVTNQYAESTIKASRSVQTQTQDLAAFRRELAGATDASKEFWREQAAAGEGESGEGGGFQGLAQELLGTTPEAQAKSITDNIKGIYSSAMNDVYTAYANSAQEIWAKRLERIAASFEQKKEAVRMQVEALDAAFEQKQERFSDRWEKTMERFKDRWENTMEKTRDLFESRRQAVEDDAERRIAAVDRRVASIDREIERINKQKEKEAELERQRQKHFDREKRRIERLTDLANRNIGFNRALVTGDLDEAARVQNNMQSAVIGWGVDDSRELSAEAAERAAKNQDKIIERLRKERDAIRDTTKAINDRKKARIDALRDEEKATLKSLQKQRDAENKSLDRRKKAEQKAMQESRDIEKKRLQNRLDNISKDQQATERAERKKQEMQRRTLEIELATLKTFIPQNQQQLATHIGRVGRAYSNFGLDLQGAGSHWGRIVGNALSNNVGLARRRMSNDANWASYGRSVANAISKGAFNMTLNQFMKFLVDGKLPRNWEAGKSGGFASFASGLTQAQNRALSVATRHAGGFIDDSPGSRNARGGSSLGSDEKLVLAQRGEFMLPRGAVQLLGSANLNLLKEGKLPGGADNSVGMSAMPGMLMATMGKSMVHMASLSMAYQFAQRNAEAAMAFGMPGMGGGHHPNLSSAMSFAQAQAGKPYIWGGNGPTGYDCCLIPETMVYGPDGARPIEEIRAGDRVYAHVENKLVEQTVVAAWKSKTQPVFRVRTRNRAVVGSANHPFLRVVQDGDNIDVQWSRLDELQPGDLLVQPREMVTSTKPDPVLSDGTIVSEDIAWLIGAALGDGTVTDRSLRLCLYGEKRERADKIAREAFSVNPCWGDSYGMIISNLAFARALEDLGMRKNGPDKKVPDSIWHWNEGLQRAFLDGYCDADGHRPKDHKRHGERTYSSCSRRLIDDVRALHIMLGDAVSNVSTNSRKKEIVIKGKVVKNALPLHTFAVWPEGRTGEVVLRKNRIMAKMLDEGDFTFTRVLSVSEEGIQDTYDIEVEGAHNFIADGIVVHNSGYLSAVANVLTGKPPHGWRFATGMAQPGKSLGPFKPGLGGVFDIGVTRNAGNGIGHTSGTLGGVNIEATPPRVLFGAKARAATDKLYNMHFHIPGVGGGSSMGASAPKSALQAMVRAKAQGYGWDSGPQWEALNYIISKESSWNPNAQNPTSTAYGLFQFLDATWRNYGFKKTSDPAKQTDAGLEYIRRRYTTAVGAKNFHLRNNWYDSGGDLHPGLTTLYNGTNQVETVVTASTRKLLVDALNKATFSYEGFKDVLKSVSMGSISPGANQQHPVNNYYDYKISIDGSPLDAKELKSVIKETVNEINVGRKKKRGTIR